MPPLRTRARIEREAREREEEGGWLEASVLRPLLRAARRAEGPLGELTEQGGRLVDEVGTKLGTKILRGLACSPRDANRPVSPDVDAEGNPKPRSLGGLLSRTIDEIAVNTAKIVDKVDEGMEEKMLKLKGAAQDLFGSKERWVALVPKPGQLAPPGVACATAVVFKSTVITFGGLGARGLAGELWRCDLPGDLAARRRARASGGARRAHGRRPRRSHVHLRWARSRRARPFGGARRLPPPRPPPSEVGARRAAGRRAVRALLALGGALRRCLTSLAARASRPTGRRTAASRLARRPPSRRARRRRRRRRHPRFRMLGDLKFLPLEESLEEAAAASVAPLKPRRRPSGRRRPTARPTPAGGWR